MRKNVTSFVVLGVALIAGSLAGYAIATNPELVGRIKREAKGMLDTSRKRMDEMSEDMALKKAKLTRNPKVNQDWVENQWEALGL